MRKAFFGRLATLLCLALAIAACDRSKTADSSARSYQVRGIVRGFAPDQSTVSIEHEDIPGFMPSMTMPFSVKDEKEIAEVKIGDGISFRMTVTDKDLFLDQVKKIPASEVRVAQPTPAASVSSTASARLRDGDVVPSFALINQNGDPVTLDTFRGQPFLLTFIFTRCPIPTFCPRISNNFSELQQAIKSEAGAAGKTRLLSITLDPQFDTPEILRSYAQQQKADPQIWTFATGAPAEIDKLTQSFAVFVQPEGGTISHGLATALIGRDGRIVKLWRGNGWTPGEVIAAITRQHEH
ncbi:MAG TPA: SCO family protein [Chthoniobacterales bacterium]|nr:SCO family protein [Chthoniobacterales bacterium]